APRAMNADSSTAEITRRLGCRTTRVRRWSRSLSELPRPLRPAQGPDVARGEPPVEQEAPSGIRKIHEARPPAGRGRERGAKGELDPSARVADPGIPQVPGPGPVGVDAAAAEQP